jgi:hypothetical protein
VTSIQTTFSSGDADGKAFFIRKDESFIQVFVNIYRINVTVLPLCVIL